MPARYYILVSWKSVVVAMPPVTVTVLVIGLKPLRLHEVN